MPLGVGARVAVGEAELDRVEEVEEDRVRVKVGAGVEDRHWEGEGVPDREGVKVGVPVRHSVWVGLSTGLPVMSRGDGDTL